MAYNLFFSANFTLISEVTSATEVPLYGGIKAVLTSFFLRAVRQNHEFTTFRVTLATYIEVLLIFCIKNKQP